MDDSDAPPANEIEESIDSIDREMLQLIERRAALVGQLCRSEPPSPLSRVARASQRIGKLLTESVESKSLSREAQSEILRHISGACLQALHRLQVFYLGPMHSYSHLAALKYFADPDRLAPVASIPAVFDAVSRGDAATGIVPIENSTDGRVVDTLGMFVRNRETKICGEVLLPIHHNLLSRTPRDQIREVHSKPQALSQCRAWLASELPGARLVEVSSTALAARSAAEQPGVAAVASIEAGREHDLDVLAANIEDNANNVTRFAVLGKEMPAPSGDDKTALLFQVSHQPGALADAMTTFKENRLNLTWIESFPAPQAKNEYLFFVELSGHRDDPSVSDAIASLMKQTQQLTILGSFPRAELDDE